MLQYWALVMLPYRGTKTLDLELAKPTETGCKPCRIIESERGKSFREQDGDVAQLVRAMDS